ncbi:MAG TPA: hypothetical protein VGN23_09860 [Verrucomicrobiae bacterium]
MKEMDGPTLGIIAGLIGVSVLMLRVTKKKVAIAATPECTLEQIPEVFSRLKQEGTNGSFAVFMFQPPDSSKTDDAINIQFSIEQGKIGVDWCLIGPINIRDKDKLEQFLSTHKYKYQLREMNGMKYVRVEEGNLPGLCQKVIKDLYAQRPDVKLDMVVEGFSWP